MGDHWVVCRLFRPHLFSGSLCMAYCAPCALVFGNLAGRRLWLALVLATAVKTTSPTNPSPSISSPEKWLKPARRAKVPTAFRRVPLRCRRQHALAHCAGQALARSIQLVCEGYHTTKLDLALLMLECPGRRYSQQQTTKARIE